MPHQIFNCQKIRPVFIKVCSESMTERVAGKPVFPAEGLFVGTHMPRDIKSINRPGRIRLFRKKPAGGTAVCKPVVSEDIVVV